MSRPTRAADESNVYMLYGLVAEEMERAREAGREPDFSDLLARHPEQANEVRRIIPAIETLYQLGERSDDGKGDALPSASVLPIEDLGDFRLARELGRGGMGIVYEAVQLSLGRRVAVKVLPFAALLDKRQLERFRNEARAAAILKHPHIVSVYSVGCERSIHFYAMELIEGQTLADAIREMHDARQGTRDMQPRIRREQRQSNRPAVQTVDRDTHIYGADATPSSLDTMQTSQDCSPTSPIDTTSLAAISTEHSANRKSFYRSVARLGLQAAEALHYAHGHGVIHRDIKPSNLLLDEDGQLHIADFGLARIQTGKDLTMTGDIVGTLRYMSPEQLDGHVVDERTDVYSLGVTLYEIVTGVPAFRAQSRPELTNQLLKSNPKRPTKIDHTIPRDLETVILKSVERDPSARYATADDMAEDLRRFLQDRPVSARRVSNLERARRWALRNRVLAALLTTVAALLLVLAGGSSAVSWRMLYDARSREIGLYARDMRLTQQAIERGSYLEAEQTLLNWVPTDGAEDHRGFEWYHLWKASHDPAINWTISHPLPVYSVTFAGDDDKLAVGWFSNKVSIWSLDSRPPIVPVRQIGLNTVCAHRVVAVPQCESVVIGINDGELVEVQARTGQELARIDLALPQHADEVTSIDVTVDGRYLACSAGRRTGSIHVWDRVERRIVFSQKHLVGRCQVAFDANGKLLVVYGEPAKLAAYDIASATREAEFDLNAGHCRSLDVSPDRSRLAVGVHEDRGEERVSRIDMWDTESLTRTWALSVAAEYVSSIVFSPDGKRLIAGTYEGTIRLVNASNGVVHRTKQAHSGEVTGLACSVDDRHFASSGTDGNVHIWSVSAFEVSDQAVERRKVPALVSGAAFTDSRTAVFADRRGGVHRWDVRAGQVEAYFDVDSRHKDGDAVHLATSRDGRLIVVTWGHWPQRELPSKVEVFDVAANRAHSSYELPSGTSYTLSSFSPDNRLLAICSRGQVVVIDLKKKDIVHELPCGKSVKATAFSPNGRWLACASTDGKTRLYQVPSFTNRRVCQTDSPLTESVDFSPDSRLFVTAGMDRRVRLFETSTGHAVGADRFKQLADLLVLARFSPDGRRIVSGGLDGKVRVWHVESGEELLSFDVDRGSFPIGQFSPDGKSVVVGCGDDVFAFRTADANELRGLSRSELSEIACQNLIDSQTRN